MKSWPRKSLGAVSEFVRGISFKPTDLVQLSTADSLACFRTKNIQDSLKMDDVIHIPRSFLKSERQVVREGDILISTANSNNLVGKCCVVPPLAYPATLGGFIAAIRANPSLQHPRFLYYWLSSPATQERLRRLARQTTNISNLPLAEVAKEQVPSPSLTEQQRIVRLLDEADALRRLRVRADGRSAEFIPARFHEMFGDPAENCQGHNIQRLELVCRRITDGTHQPPAFAGKGIPFLFVRNIVNGFIDFDTEKFITEETFAELTRRVKPERGDILYSTVGSYGVAVEVETDRKFTFQRHIGHLKPDRHQIDTHFLTAQLNMPWLRAQADQAARGIAQKTVNLAELRKFKVLVPPLPLQKDFAKRVTEIRELQAEQANTRRRLEDLFQSLLHCAFRGQL